VELLTQKVSETNLEKHTEKISGPRREFRQPKKCKILFVAG
jgi:hypothetical protein